MPQTNSIFRVVQRLGGTRIWDLAMVHGDICEGLSDKIVGGHYDEQSTRIQEREAEVHFLRQQLGR
jgi:hypothetical protein